MGGTSPPVPPSHLCMRPQVFDNTPAALDGTVAAGDEITGVNGKSIKGKTKVEVAKMIQEVKVGDQHRWTAGVSPLRPWQTSLGSGDANNVL